MNISRRLQCFERHAMKPGVKPPPFFKEGVGGGAVFMDAA